MLATCQVEGCTSSHMQEILLTLDGLQPTSSHQNTKHNRRYLLVLPRTQRKLNSTNLQPCRSTTVKSFVFSSVTISYIPMVQTLMACKFFRETQHRATFPQVLEKRSSSKSVSRLFWGQNWSPKAGYWGKLWIQHKEKHHVGDYCEFPITESIQLKHIFQFDFGEFEG